MTVPVLLFITFFLILSLVLVCIYIVKKSSLKRGVEELEELEVVDVVDESLDKAVRVVESMQLMELEKTDMIVSEDTASDEVAFDELASSEVASLEAASSEATSPEVTSPEATVLEGVATGNIANGGFMFWRPFTFAPRNPVFLKSEEDMPDVIYEQDGIHFINNNLHIDKNTEEKLNNDFMKLVESVVGKI